MSGWLAASKLGLLAMALIVGVGSGLAAAAFRELIYLVTWLFTGHQTFGQQGHAPSAHLAFLGIFFVLVVPVIAGAVYGPLIQRFAREARGHGVPEVMLSVAENGGRIRPPVTVVKALASALCIGGGGSVGREGPIVQIGSALASTLGQLVRMSEGRLRVIVACGAAGGISATFNAPIAGVFFGLELILRDFEAESFGVVVLSSFVADIIGRAAFGSHPFLTLPPFQLRSPVEYPLYIGLGVAAAVVGVVFIRVLYGMEDVADRLWAGRPEWLRPAAGGVLLGLLLLALPELYGVGYPPLERAIGGQYVVGLLLLLLVGKIVATSLTIAIGGSGGVFAPSLFMGAMLGSAYGAGVHHLLPHLTAPAGTYGLVGMGAVFAAAARAPITAVIIIFELTGDYRIILPLMFAIALAAGISSLLSRDTIYTLKLRRRGIDIMRGRGANLMQLVRVSEAMQPLPLAVPDDMPLNEAIARLAEATTDGLPVVDGNGRYRGTIATQQVEEAMRENALDVTAGELAQDLPALFTDQTVEDALGALLRARSGLPVVQPDGRMPVGWLTHVDVLRAYNARLEGASSRPDACRVVEVELAADDDPVGRTLAELALPAGSSVIALRRNDNTVSPSSGVRLERGDRLTLLVPADAADEVADALSAPPGTAGRPPGTPPPAPRDPPAER